MNLGIATGHLVCVTLIRRWIVTVKAKARSLQASNIAQNGEIKCYTGNNLLGEALAPETVTVNLFLLLGEGEKHVLFVFICVAFVFARYSPLLLSLPPLPQVLLEDKDKRRLA